ncbi:MAG TPA: hypothetical protein VFD46_04980 [Chryseolinea sp.]|nr:hypothetical protein [Chryseolinea sp.]
MFLLRLSPSAVATRRRSGMAADLQNLTNLFLYLFSKVAVLYWAVGIILGANYYFDLYSHRHWMILIVLALFGNQWLTVNRVFGRAGLKWMAVTFATIVLMSYVFSRFPVINFSLVGNMVAKHEPSTYYRVDLPHGPSEAISSDEVYGFHGVIRRFHHSIRIGIGYPLKTSKTEPETFINDFPFDSTWSKDIGQYITTRKMEYHEVDRDAIPLHLSIDKNVPMGIVKELKKKLSKSNVHQIFLTFGSYPVTTYLSQRLYSYCDDYYSGRVDVPVDSISMTPIFCSDDQILARPDLVIVASNKDVLANGTKMSVNQLHDVCVQFLKEGNEPRYIKMFFADDLSFNQYVSIYNEVLRAYRDYMDENFNSELGFTFREALKNPYSPDYNSSETLSTKVMMSGFFELTNAEKEFMIRKLPATKVLFEGND